MWLVFSLLTCEVCVQFAFASDPRFGSDFNVYGQRDCDFLLPRQEYNGLWSLPHSESDFRCSDRERDEYRVVRTYYGPVRGKTVTLCDGPGLDIRRRPGQSTSVGYYKIINVFLGIPYATPPTRLNNLQFKPPQPPQKQNLFCALHYKPACPQNEEYFGLEKGFNKTDEDCLYLNIYTPGVKSPHLQGYPVMMYIHGGNFDHGSANVFPAHMLASQDVVVVTFNYRLGHLGFLSTSDSNSVGNYGMLDQVQALSWVYENIKEFSGDPESITLFGFDAGAASAGLLAMSPLSRHMVKRVIAQNGSPVSDWGAISDRLFMFNTSRILGEVVGCTFEDSYRLVECVGKRSNNDIRILEIKPRIGWLPWGPVVDNFTNSYKAFLPKSPVEMLREGNPFRTDFSYMGGTSRDEGEISLMNEPALRRMGYKFNRAIFEGEIKEFMKRYNYTINAQGIFRAIRFLYTPTLDSNNENVLRKAYIDLLTDRYYNAPNYKIGKILLEKRIPLYMYVSNYSFEGYRPFYSWQGITSQTEYLMLTGAPFMGDKYFPSTLDLRRVPWTEADRDMSSFYIQAWTNFVKTGIPTPGRINSILWEPAIKENFATLNINSTYTSLVRYVTDRMVRNYREKEGEFWDCYLPFLVDRMPPTFPPTLPPGTEELRIVTGALYGTAAAASLFLIITVIGCILFCRIRRYDSY